MCDERREKRKRSSRLRWDDEPDDFGALIVELLAGGTNKDAPVPDTQLLTIFPRVGPESRRSGKRTLGAEVPMVVLTASAEGKLFNDRSPSSARMIFFGSARTGMG